MENNIVSIIGFFFFLFVAMFSIIYLVLHGKSLSFKITASVLIWFISAILVVVIYTVIRIFA